MTMTDQAPDDTRAATANIVERLKAVAATIAEADGASASWSEETLTSKRSKFTSAVSTLRIVSGSKVWSSQARVHEGDVESARALVASTMLAKLAATAGVCSACFEAVPRRKREPDATPRRYRCPSCLHSWVE